MREAGASPSGAARCGWRGLRRAVPGARCWAAIAALLTLLSRGSGVRAETLTEADVVRRVRASDPEVMAARASVALAEAEEVRAGLYPNPSLSWDREYLPAGAPEAEDSLFLTLPVALGGARPTERALSRAATSQGRAEAARAQSHAVREALEAFYGALAAEREVAIRARGVAWLAEAVRVVARRHAAGTLSGYERARLELEAELAQSELREAQAALHVLRTSLALRLGLEPASLELRGDLATLDPAAVSGAPRRPALRHLASASSEAQQAREAASWAWLPELSLSGGLRTGDVGDRRYGYVAGVSLELPVFSRGQELRAEAAARQLSARAEASWAELENRIELARARERLEAARREIERLTGAARERLEVLERAALSSYREGALSVGELVDARRARGEVEGRLLELQLAAKRAELELRAARGDFE